MDLVVSSTTSIFLELKKILHGILFTILKMRHLYRTHHHHLDLAHLLFFMRFLWYYEAHKEFMKGCGASFTVKKMFPPFF